MSEKRAILLDLAGKKEIKYSISSIKKSNNDRIEKIWLEIQTERLGETNELIANTFVEKLCDILESTNIIESGSDTSSKLKDRKAFMSDVKNIAGYFSSLVPYIGMLEGGIVLGKDVYDHVRQPKEENKNEASFETDERIDKDSHHEADPPE